MRLVTTRFLFVSSLLGGIVGCAQGTGDGSPEPSPTPETSEPETTEPEPLYVDISADLEATIVSTGLPAIGAAIVDQDGVRELGVAGTRSHQAGAAAAEIDDKWHLGSNTKAMTAVLAARLVQNDVVQWTTTVLDVWPDANAGWTGVTLEALLQHRGGATGSIPADYPDEWSNLFAEESHSGRLAFVALLVAAPPNETVGTFVYSNAGYMIAGAMLEVVTDKPWQQLMQDEVFTPLEMPSCGFGAPLGDDALWGHAGPDGTPVAPGINADNPRALGPAGTVHCSLEDYGKFLAVFLDDTNAYLGAESVEKLTTPEGDYALGWNVVTQPWSPGQVMAHVGSNTLWFANAWVSPALGRAYVAVTNSGQTGAFEATNAVIGDLITKDAAQ